MKNNFSDSSTNLFTWISVFVYIGFIGVMMYFSHFGLGYTYGSLQMMKPFLWAEVLAVLVLLLAVNSFYGSLKPVGIGKMEGTPPFSRKYWIPTIPIVFIYGGFFISVFIGNPSLIPAKIPELLLIFGATFFIGASEELTFRGILLPHLERRYGKLAALIVSSAMFSLLHSVNVFAGHTFETMLHQLLSSFSAGVLFGLAFLMFRRLWPVVLMHFIWDFTVISSSIVPVPGLFVIQTYGVWIMGILILLTAGVLWKDFFEERSACKKIFAQIFTLSVLGIILSTPFYTESFWKFLMIDLFSVDLQIPSFHWLIAALTLVFLGTTGLAVWAVRKSRVNGWQMVAITVFAWSGMFFFFIADQFNGSEFNPEPKPDYFREFRVERVLLKTGSEIGYLHFPNPKTSLPSVVFLHGGPGGGNTLRDIETGYQLYRKGFDVYLFDQAGVGWSENIPAEEYKVQRMIDDLEALRRVWNLEKMSLYGNSWGGVYASRYSALYPERVASLVLQSSGSYTDLQNYPNNQNLKGSGGGSIRFNPDTPPIVLQKIRQFTELEKKGVSPTILEKMFPQNTLKQVFMDFVDLSSVENSNRCAKYQLQPGEDFFAPYMEKARFNIMANVLISEDVKKQKLSDLKKIQAPTLFLRGACDFIPRVVYETLREQVPNFIGVEVPDRGHSIFLDWKTDYPYLNMVADFLRRKKISSSPGDYSTPAFENFPPYISEKTCRNKEGEIIFQGSCNDYLENLAESCKDKSQILSPSKNTCVSIRDFKAPLMNCQNQQDTSCEKAVSYPGYKPFEYNSLEDLVQFTGNADSNTILLFAQGGPVPYIIFPYIDFLEKTFWVGHIQQTNTLKPYLYYSYDLSTNEAQKENVETREIVRKVFEEVRAKFPDKKIVLIGHSMGSFVVMDYLQNYGSEGLDKVIAMAGRLKPDSDFLKSFLLHKNTLYQNGLGDELGLRKYFFENPGSQKERSENGLEFVIEPYTPNAETTILSAWGSLDYLRGLRDQDLSALLYVYSSNDEQLGGLSPAEIKFLESRGAVVRDAGWDKQALGHSRMILLPKFQSLLTDFIRN